MGKKDSNLLFNSIAPVYGLFFNYQRRWFDGVINDMVPELDVTSYHSILDVGCGTGALCSVLRDKGLTVTGVDPAEKMLAEASRRPENQDVQFVQGNAVKGLPFADKSFDLAIASYVAHGMAQPERIRLYAEMSRLARSRVIIFDYSQKRALLITIAEWLEHGDYFHFIQHVEEELRDCRSELARCFRDVRVVQVGERAAWYICTP